MNPKSLAENDVVRSALCHEVEQPDGQTADDQQEGLDLPEVIGDRQTGGVDDRGEVEQTEHHDAGSALQESGEQADQHAADQKNLLGDLGALVHQIAMLLLVVIHIVLQRVARVEAGAQLDAGQEESDAQESGKEDLQVANALVGAVEVPNLHIGLQRQRYVVHPFHVIRGVLIVEHCRCSGKSVGRTREVYRRKTSNFCLSLEIREQI